MSQKILTLLVASYLQCLTVKGEASPAATEPLVCPCDYRYNPVCGSDNVTYINECILDCTNDANPIRGYAIVNRLYSGECSNLVCQKLDLPVCTLDGQTYSNECELAVENIKRIRHKQPVVYLAYRAECIGPPWECTNLAAPICGDDDILYRNECVLDSASDISVKRGLRKISLKNYGSCLNWCLCPKTKDIVCGSDGQIYNNICELQCANRNLDCSKNELVKIVDKSVCESCWCTAQYDPVCGSDGKTYSNECRLNCTAKIQNNPHLVAISGEECSKCYCNDDDKPVCGTNHVTYRNECYLRCANIAQMSLNDISIYHYGACLPEDDCSCSYCPEEYKPVCGNNRQTYWNVCWLLCTADCLKTVGKQGIWPTSNEACCI